MLWVLCGCATQQTTALQAAPLPIDRPCLTASDVPSLPDLRFEDAVSAQASRVEQLRALMHDREVLLVHALRSDAKLRGCVK
jgi:hypothetical protein